MAYCTHPVIITTQDSVPKTHALYDGKQYLVEKYAVALSVGLQLLDPKPLVQQQLRALTAGLTQPPPGFSKFAPLLAIKSEFDGIIKAGVSTTSLVDGDFKKRI